MKRLSGFTLVELLMTMMMGSSLMLMGIGLVHQSMTMSKLAKVRSEHSQTLNRLSQQFRSDVHSASEVISVTAESVALKLAEGTVTYKQDGASIKWEQVSAGTVVAHEFFRLDERTMTTFASESEPNRVVIQVERRLESIEIPSPIDLRVVAVVGRWKQLESAGGNP